MKLTLREQMMLTAMKTYAGRNMPADVIHNLLGMSSQATVVCIRRLCHKLIHRKIVVERVSKLGRGHTGEYAIPLTIADA